ncbi:MAG: efflux RND transporter periplasmic adaptor subunit, partial [Candidatus Aminicenantes bacterium]|nr:efflux RND transporter periplasmic adaptor subunit [Candidatus Aminicenantes bacterium]
KISAVYSDLGQTVKKGERLLIVNSPEFAQAQADFLEARVRMILSEAEYKRAKKLLAEKAIEEKEYLRREAEYRKLSTEFGALGSHLHSFGITHKQIDVLIAECDSLEQMEYKCELADPLLPVRSPLSGRIIFRDAVVGEHIVPEKTLLKVADLSFLWADLDAYEKDLPFIREDSRVTVHTPLYPEKEFEGRILNINDIVDENLRTVKIRLEVNNEAGLLKPQMYIQGKIRSQPDGEKKWMVPDEAVQNLDEGKILFIREAPEDFHVRHVTVGPKIGKNRIILSGLSEADQVVVKGAFTLKTELSKGTFGGGHVH